jgi:endonuclease G
MRNYKTLTMFAVCLLASLYVAPAMAFDGPLAHSAKIAMNRFLASQQEGQSTSEDMSVTRGAPNSKCPEFQAYGYPASSASAEKRSYFLCRGGYAGQYDTSEKGSLWIAEHISKAHLGGDANRKGVDFNPDPQIPTNLSANDQTYKRSGFDKGHLAPAADFKESQELMDQSFYYSNAVPQRPEHNRGIWANLEGAVREMATRRGELYVVTGPVYSGDNQQFLAGTRIPDALYKVLVDTKTHEMTAFVIPNENGLGDDPAPYQTSVRSVEKITGLNFNPDLSRANADKMELSSDWIMPKVRVKFND